MTEAFRAELAEIMSLIQTATISGEGHHTMAWCIKQLPGLYGQHRQTHESRYGAEILRLQQAILGKLADAPSSPQGQAVGEAVLGRFHLLNERFGLPGIDLKAPRSRSKKGELSG